MPTMRGSIRPILTTTIVMLTTAVGGCAVRNGGGVVRTTVTPSPIDWPERTAEPDDATLVEEESTCGWHELAANETGRLYELDFDPRREGTLAIRFDAVPADMRWAWSPRPHRDELDARDIRIRALMFISSEPPIEMTLDHGPGSRELVVPAVPRARAIAVVRRHDREPCGICVMTTGLGGFTRVETAIRNALIDRGWVLVSVAPDLMRATRLQRQAKFKRSGPLPALIDNELVDETYAVALSLEQLMRGEPAFRDLPVVLVGSSLGAITLPACAARLATAPEPIHPAAVVLVGGGAGVDRLLLDTSMGHYWLSQAGIDIANANGEVDAATRAEVASETQLAPERCLWALDGVPALLVDGQFDAIVPRATADQLWALTGRPERWSYPVGHIGLFVLVGDDQWHRVADWIDQTARGRQSASNGDDSLSSAEGASRSTAHSP